MVVHIDGKVSKAVSLMQGISGKCTQGGVS